MKILLSFAFRHIFATSKEKEHDRFGSITTKQKEVLVLVNEDLTGYKVLADEVTKDCSRMTRYWSRDFISRSDVRR